MLEIIVNHQAIDLPKDISIAMTIENPFVSEGRIPFPYSLDFDLPDSDKNLRIFNYPNRLATYNVQSINRSFPCVIRFSGLHIVSGNLVLRSYQTSIRVNFSAVDFSSAMQQSMFSTPLGNMTLEGSYALVDWENMDNYARKYRDWAKSAINGADDRLVIAPIGRDTDQLPFKWAVPGRSSNLGIQTPMSIRINQGWYNAFNPVTQEFYFTDTTSNTKKHVCIFPQFRLGYLMKQIIGDHLTANPFVSSLFRDLVVPSYYFPTYLWALDISPMVSNIPLSGSAYLPNGTPRVDWKDFMPDIGANEFIKSIMKLFCHTLYQYKREFRIISNDDILSRAVNTKWTDKLMIDPTFDMEEGKRYVYGHEDLESYQDTATPITVANINAMVNHAMTVTPDNEYEAIFYCTETKQVFRKHGYINSYRIGSSTVNEICVDYEFLGYRINFDKIEKSGSVYDSTSDIKIPTVYPTVYFRNLTHPLTTEEKYYMAVPRHTPLDLKYVTRSAASRQRESNFELMMFQGAKPVANAPSGTPTYPYLSPYGNDDLSLFWEGETGLYNQFHARFAEWVQRAKLRLSGNILLTPLDLHNLDITDKVHVDGRNFFIEKIQFTIQQDHISPASVELIEV